MTTFAKIEVVNSQDVADNLSDYKWLVEFLELRGESRDFCKYLLRRLDERRSAREAQREALKTLDAVEQSGESGSRRITPDAVGVSQLLKSGLVTADEAREMLSKGFSP